MPRMKLAPWQSVVLHQPFQHFAFYGGVATGKTYTGSHFSINHILRYPELTGFIGANTYDQLSQATLREFFFWLEHYGFEFVVDRRPPLAWGPKRTLKTYNNTIHVRDGKKGTCTLIFTRVLAKGNPIRGIEFSWYWIDELRDTPENTHDILLSRMRESDLISGLATTTPNGESWDFQRFVRGSDSTLMYGSMHVPTIESVKAGIISEKYYTGMRRSYSPMMALQELDAQHVNVLGGRAYYAASEANKCRVAPWGDTHPNHLRPLVVGCDFNFQPAPCVWMVGQVGPALHGPNGEWWGDCIHWFGEISEVEASTRQMTRNVIGRYPGFHYWVYGDRSGNQGTTSNAGETDYHQIGDEMSLAECMFTIVVDQEDPSESKQNPRVKKRVENMNAMFKNALGEIRQTYDPVACPLFDGDVRMVGWKQNVLLGRGKLDDGGDNKRTHATDGGGYAVYKIFPPGRRVEIIDSVVSQVRASVDRDDLRPNI